MALIDTNNITTEENLIDFLLDQYEETKKHMFLTAANSIALYRRDVSLLNFCIDKSNEWISVKDRLPNHCEDCLMLLDNKERKLGWYRADIKEFIENGGFVLINDVTHWIPLPEPPTEKEN